MHSFRDNNFEASFKIFIKAVSIKFKENQDYNVFQNSIITKATLFRFKFHKWLQMKWRYKLSSQGAWEYDLQSTLEN